jgi:ABC-type nitrate/sulfonate/bicarbonate transport system permease component
MRRALARLVPAALLTLALLGAWELYVDLAGVQADLLPAPHAVAAALYNERALLWGNFTVTAREVLLGLGLALAAGFALAVAIHFFAILRRAVYPLAVGVIGAFIAETTTPTSGIHPGLGREIMTDVNFQASRAYAGTAILFAFAVACFYALGLAERRLAPWRTTTAGAAR